jgi:replicative DNA helicase
MIVIGARPSVGKSAFVTQIASYMCKQGKRVGFYNLEMQDKQIYERILAAESGIGLKRIKRALAFTGDERERFERANDNIKRLYQGLVVNTGAKKISDIRSESRHMNYDIIIIDYMQLILPEDRYKGNRFAEVGQISHEIKALAMELNIPIIALSQLNRVSVGKDTKEPTMAELRESGDVEQDASIIMLMWNLNEERTVKGLKVDKNRQGEVGKEKLNFEGHIMRFIEDGSEFTEAEDDIPVFK